MVATTRRIIGDGRAVLSATDVWSVMTIDCGGQDWKGREEREEGKDDRDGGCVSNGDGEDSNQE